MRSLVELGIKRVGGWMDGWMDGMAGRYHVSLDIIRLLLDNGALVRRLKGAPLDSLSPIAEAMFAPHFDEAVVEALLERDARAIREDDVKGWCLFHLAVALGCQDSVQFMISRGAEGESKES